MLQSVPKVHTFFDEATNAAWILKKSVLPWLYWNAMLRGKEWLAKPTS